MKNSAQKGITSIFIIILVVAVAGAWLLTSFDILNLNFSINTDNFSQTSSIDKSDPEWLWNYCVSEIQKLPKAPMEYTQELPVDSNGPSLYIKDIWAADLEDNNSETCQIEYEYEDRVAYPSVGVEYIFDIKYGNQFSEALSSLYSGSMPEGWEYLRRLTDKEDGRPGYVSDALPLVYMRETADTVEYLDVFDAVSFYVELTVYEK